MHPSKLLHRIHKNEEAILIEELMQLTTQELLLTNLSLNISIYSLIKKMSMTIDDLIQKVKDQQTVELSVVTLLNDTNQRLKTALSEGDMSKLQQLSTMLDDNTKILADAVVQNTPAAAPVTEPQS